MRRRFGWAVGVLLLIAIIFIAGPSFLTRDLITALFFTFIFITLAANYEILGGFLGYLNLGQAAFFGLGGYTTFIMIVKVSAIQALGPFVRSRRSSQPCVLLYSLPGLPPILSFGSGALISQLPRLVLSCSSANLSST